MSSALPFKMLGPYELIEVIGRGGMGEVWRARDPRLNREVAIKTSLEGFSGRFQEEAAALATLNHPHICHIYDVGPDYLVMEFIEGQTLAARIQTGALPLDEATPIATQIASALEAAHKRGVLHRDLKPSNVMLSQFSNRAWTKLLDFGLAKMMNQGDIGETTQTMAGTVVGTAAYMSPEQVRGKPLDERSDIFSFGAVLYEMLTGRRAFGGSSLADVLSAVLRDQPAPIDSQFSPIIRRCLAKVPDERYQSMAELKAAIEFAVAERPAEILPSIAVLPFANISRDGDDEYFSDGLTEEILNVLAHIPGLKVTARTSSFAFRGKDLDIRKIAERLGVRTILEGSVRRAGNQIRVTVQLISAADGYHLWSDRYDRELTDVFAVQDEIAASISNALQLKLTGKPVGARPYKPKVPAWETFLQGRHHFFKVSPASYARAEEYFKQAVALDPQWADPHSALGNLYFSAGLHGWRPLKETIPMARASANMALGFLPQDAMAHAVLCLISALHDYDWKEADERFRLAWAGESPHQDARQLATYYLTTRGRFDEAIVETKEIIAQDPLNVSHRSRLAFTLFHAGRYEEGLVEARKGLELGGESYYRARMAIAVCLAFQGNFIQAREAAEDVFRVAPFEVINTGLLAGLLAMDCQTDRADKLVTGLRDAIPFGMMMYYMIRSEMDAALDYYQKGIELRHPVAAQWAFAEFLKPLRYNPLWPTVTRMMNLPENGS